MRDLERSYGKESGKVSTFKCGMVKRWPALSSFRVTRGSVKALVTLNSRSESQLYCGNKIKTK